MILNRYWVLVDVLYQEIVKLSGGGEDALKTASGFYQNIGCNIDGKDPSSLMEEVASFVYMQEKGKRFELVIDEKELLSEGKVVDIIGKIPCEQFLFSPEDERQGIWYHSGRIFY